MILKGGSHSTSIFKNWNTVTQLHTSHYTLNIKLFYQKPNILYTKHKTTFRDF